MAWKNYDHKIILGFGYKLVGWPSHLPITNGIDNLSESVLHDISSGLQQNIIHWKSAPESEIDSLRKTVSVLPQRSDKGVKRKRYNNAKSSDGKHRFCS